MINAIKLYFGWKEVPPTEEFTDAESMRQLHAAFQEVKSYGEKDAQWIGHYQKLAQKKWKDYESTFHGMCWLAQWLTGKVQEREEILGIYREIDQFDSSSHPDRLKAAEFGYAGHALAGARAYLQEVFKQFGEIIESSDFPSQYRVYQGSWPFRVLNVEATVRKLKEVPCDLAFSAQFRRLALDYINSRKDSQTKCFEEVIVLLGKHGAGFGQRVAASMLSCLFNTRGIWIDRDHKVEGSFPLHRQLLKQLLELGADAQGSSYYRPIDYVIGDYDLVQLFIEHSRKVGLQDNFLYKVAERICFSGKPESLKLLLETGIDRYSCQRLLCSYIVHLELNPHRKVNFNILSLLMIYSMEMPAVQLDRALSRPEVLKFLLAHGLQPDQRLEGGKTALHVAVEKGKREAVEILLRHGADPYLKDHKKQTPASLAKGKPEIEALINTLSKKRKIRKVKEWM